SGGRLRAALAAVLVRDAFGQMKVLDVNAARIARYVNDRLAVGMARASVNRELAALKRALSLAVEQERFSSAPKIKMLTEAPPRQGFVKPGEFEAIVRHQPAHLQDFARFGYLTGTREGEIAKLAWCEVDREGQRITFRREHAKNGQPRVIPFVGSLAEIIERRWEAREYKAPAGPGISALVFHRQGNRIADCRKRWPAAGIAAGRSRPTTAQLGRPVVTREGRPVMRPALIFHDLRRSAVRNLVSAGVDQTVAMKITGHRTVSVFQRYRIVSDDDVLAALERTEAALKTA